MNVMTKESVNDYKKIKELNSKLRYILPMYFITDFGLVYGKTIVPYSEQFINIKDDYIPDEYCNILVDGDDFYVHDKENRVTGIQCIEEGDNLKFISPPRDKKGELVTPPGAYVRRCPREDGVKWKNTFYRYFNNLDLFGIKALPYQPISEFQTRQIEDGNDIDIFIDGKGIIIDSSLFPDVYKGRKVPILSAALLANEVVAPFASVRDDEAFFIIKNETKMYDSYTLLKVMLF